MHALEVNNLKKSYKNGVQALKGVSFAVEQGDFFGLLGPNGAGKSTLINICTSLSLKTAGQVNIMGYDIDHDFSRAKQHLGVTPQEFNFNAFAKLQDIVVDQAGYYGIPRKIAIKRAKKYLDLLGLGDKCKQPSRTLSGGMKRRLMIARALVHQPDVLILDEPTAGVDIELRRSMWEFLRQLNAEGTTIILTTHYLEEAESLCRNIAIINQGCLIENTSTSNLLDQLEKEYLILYTANPYETLPELQNYQLRKIDATSIEVELKKGIGLHPLFDALHRHGLQINSMRNKSNRLEELFLTLTSQQQEKEHGVGE